MRVLPKLLNLNESSKTPNLFLYSLVLPVFWLTFGFVLDAIAPGKRLGMFGLFLIIYATLIPICWHFTKNFGRHFNKGEKIKLIIFLTLWAVICELWALWYYVSFESTSGIDEAIYGVIGFTVAIDALFMTLGVQFAAKRINNHFLNRMEEKDA